jgi:hypothetical protein
LEEKLRAYATEYERVKNEIPMYTSIWTDRIEDCVRTHALSAVHIYFDVLLTFMKHDYMDRFIQQHYWQLKPMEEQVHKANRMCQLISRTARAEQVLLVPRGCLREESTEIMLTDGSEQAQYNQDRL